MATYLLTAGVADTLNLFPTLGVDDVVVTPAESTGETDIVNGFETIDLIDISAFPDLTAEMLIDGAVAIVGGVRLETPFGTLTLPGITRGQLTVENFIVTGDNGPPIALDDTATAIGEGAIDIMVLANDSDPLDDPLSISDFPTSSTEGGTIALNDNGTPDDGSDDFLNYTPAAGFTGTDSFDYTISDNNEDNGGPFTNTATVTVTVEANAAPVAVEDNVRVIVNEESLIPVLINDSDENPSDTLSVTGVSDPTNGTVSIVDNQVSYSPAADFTGADIFTYTISDSQGATAEATVNIFVEPGDDTLTGTSGPDLLIGEDQLDSITGTRERIEGEEGDDIIAGGLGADILSGGAGADRFLYRSLADSGADPAAPTEGGDNIVDFDPTIDTIVLDFEVAPGIMVSSDDVEINDQNINFGFATIGLNTANTEPDFLADQFVISLSGLATTTTAEEIRGRIEFVTQ